LKTIAFNTLYPELNQDNFLFKNSESIIGDNLLKPFLEIKKYAAIKNYDVCLINSAESEKIDAYVFIDMPKIKCINFQRALKSKKPLFLLALESRLINPESYDTKNHKYFIKIFTWDDNLVNNEKYIKINYSHDLPVITEAAKIKEKLLTLIAGNKYSSHPDELYSKRVEAIRWFEKNHPSDFDLYGTNWNKNTFFGSRWLGLLNKLNITRKIFAPIYSSYRGRVLRKKPILEKYKFAICYENAKNHSGYITEKIFDCFFSGCVPIYWGADNILDYIPKDTFIDKRNFSSNSDLYAYISNMNDSVYNKYIENINKFISTSESYAFSNELFSKEIIDEVISHL
jgi:hypothetical protein